jgi:hypothetical protein
LSRVFRGKYLERVRTAFEQGKLVFPARLQALTDAHAFNAWLRPLYAKEWVVYAKRPFGGPEQVLKYLARYTHRVAISNSRLLALTPSPLGREGRGEGKVTFRYKDYAEDSRQKTMTLDAVEFLRRFVQHVLPKGFTKIRHYGLLASRGRNAKLKESRRLLLLVNAAALFACAPPARDATEINPAPLPHCPHCGGQRFLRLALPQETIGSMSSGDTS